jgi:diguanylate cyclase (GGDEF)-like protein
MFSMQRGSINREHFGAVVGYTVLTALVYFLSAKMVAPLSLSESESIFAIWPPTGVALSFLLFRGYIVMGGIFLGAFLLNLTLSPVPVALEIAVGNTLGPLLAYRLISVTEAGNDIFQDMRTVSFFILFCAAGALVTSLMGTTVLFLNAILSLEHWLLGWSTWFFGDLIGFLLIVPVVIAYGLQRRIAIATSYRIVEILLLFVFLIATGALIFGSGYFFNERYPVEYLILFPLIWASARFRPGINLLFLIATTVMAILGTAYGYSQFVFEGEENLSLVMLQFFIFTVTFAVLLMTAQRCNNIRMYEEKERMTLIDPLTGCGNRRMLSMRLKTELEKSRRYNRPLSAIMFDIDHFKMINDTYGHQTGDAVLKELSSLIAARLRSSDIMARWGGEEFIIVLPETDLRQSAQTAEKLRIAIEQHPFPLQQDVTCSFGVVQCIYDDTTDSVVKRVDDRLYEAKEYGRNRVAYEV